MLRAMPPRTDFEFLLDRFPAADLASFAPFFALMPVDPYIQGHFRRRRFSRFVGAGEHFHRLRHTAFVQSRDVNYLAGGVRREFAEVEDGLVALPAFHALVDEYVRVIGLDAERSELGIHQIRILCSPEFAGDPAPEGIHQDGFDYVGIFCIARDNVEGADTQLFRSKDTPPIFHRTLQPGEAVFANDRRVFHYTTPVHPATPGEGHRDVFVITANA